MPWIWNFATYSYSYAIELCRQWRNFFNFILASRYSAATRPTNFKSLSKSWCILMTTSSLHLEEGISLSLSLNFINWNNLTLYLPFHIIAGQRIMTIQLDGIQYYISRMNPYSPELNYYLAYQYCRSLGLQLASFDSKEKYTSIVEYLTNAKFNNYDFWTSGNRLGTGMFLWMSTGLPFNSTFDYFVHDPAANGVLDPVDHNGNTSPQRTARDNAQK